MAHVAKEMERQGFKHPAADRRRDHLARPHRGEDRAAITRGPVVYVKMPRARVGVCSNLLSADAARRLRRRASRPNTSRCANATRNARRGQACCPLAEARANGFKTDWTAYHAARPRLARPARRSRITRSTKIAERIDWTPFFQAWELPGATRRSLHDEVVGEEARKAVRRRAGHAEEDHRRKMAHRQCRDRPVPGQQR